jgi:hypothetical protein
MGRHFIWSNFPISRTNLEEADIHNGTIKEMSDLHGFDLTNFKIEGGRKNQIYRNCVHPETGLHILNCFLDSKKDNQIKLAI